MELNPTFSRMRNHLIFVGSLVALSLLGTGCSDPVLDEPLAAPSPAPAATESFIVVNPNQSSASLPPGMAQPVIPAEPSNPLPEAIATEQTLHTLNMFLLEYQAGGGNIPATVDEMVSMKIVPKVPPPPFGKRFEVDRQKAVITFADI
jgi:hypothetical protein